MNIQQFQYILALAEHRHFEEAAEHSFVTQSTLSTMISRLEDEIGIRLFDRKKKPLELTAEGAALLPQIRNIIRDIEVFNELTKEIKGETSGNLSLSVIPTIAPFLLPLFLQEFAAKFPKLHITVKEETTGEIIRKIKTRELDLGIVSTPLNDNQIEEWHLYDEPFVFYDAGKTRKKPANMTRLETDRLCLLEEGHCMRTQVMSLCDIENGKNLSHLNFNYKAGSIDSLLRFVKANKATTLLPLLSTVGMTGNEMLHISHFSRPQPYRSIGIVHHQHFVRKNVRQALQDAIQSKVKQFMTVTHPKGHQMKPV